VVSLRRGWPGRTRTRAAGRPLNLDGVAFVLVSAAFWALYIVAGSRLSAAVPGRGALAAALAGLVLLGQRVPAAAAGAIALVILASAGATTGARPSQPAAADAPVFADTGGVGRHASPGSTTNV